jgi:hypothetical protein
VIMIMMMNDRFLFFFQNYVVKSQVLFHIKYVFCKACANSLLHYHLLYFPSQDITYPEVGGGYVGETVYGNDTHTQRHYGSSDILSISTNIMRTPSIGPSPAMMS